MQPSYLPRLSRSFALVVLGLPAVAAAQTPLDARITGLVTPGQGLTADEAARGARATSFELEATKEDTAAARAAVDQANAGYLPRLVATARYTRLSEIDSGSLGGGNNLVFTDVVGPIPDGTQLVGAQLSFPQLLNNYELTVSLTIPVSDYLLRIPQSVSAAKNSAKGVELNASATGRQVETDARAAYYSWVRAKLSTVVAQQSLEQARANLGDVRKQFEVGSTSKADVLRIESSVAQAELGVVRTTNGEELAEEQLRTVMHDHSATPLTIGEDVLADLGDGAEPYEAAVKQALGQREELRALEANERALRDQARADRASYLPRLDLVASTTYANPNPRVFPSQDEFNATWQAGAQLTWTISDILGTRAVVRQTEARAASLRAQRAQAADSVRLEVLSAWQAVKLARASIETTTKTLVTATEAYRVRRALFQNGRATGLELTDAELDLTRARFDLINARVDLRVARAQLERAVAGH